MQIIPNWHPIFVHFTVALLSIATLMQLLALVFKQARWAEQWRTVSLWNLWIGADLTFITVATGWYAFNTVNHDDPAHLVMLEHRELAIITFVLFLILAGLSYVWHKKGQQTGWLFALGMVFATGMLVSTAWHGGELVYAHGLGVQSLPDKDKHTHSAGAGSHEHADSHEHTDSHEDSDKHQQMESQAPAAGVEQQTVTEPHEHADGATHTHE